MAAIITTNTKGTRLDRAMIAATTPAIRDIEYDLVIVCDCAGHDKSR